MLALFVAGASISAKAGRRDDREARRQKEDLKISRMVVFEPDPGREKVEAMKPTWCDLTNKYEGKVMGSRLARTLTRIKDKGWYRGDITTVAEILCTHPDAPDWQKQTGYVVQGWVNTTGLGKDDALAGIRARVQRERWEKQKKEVCGDMEVSGEASEEQKRINSAMRDTFGCGKEIYWRMPYARVGDKLEWFLDKDIEIPSEVMRSYYVLNCLGHGYELKKSELYVLAGYARCGIDARKLSREKLDKEIKDKGYNEYQSILAREQLARAKDVGERYQRVIDKLVKSDPVYKRIFYEAPEKAFKSWEKDYNANKAAIDEANAFEGKLYGPSKKAMTGCAKTLRANFAKYVKSKKPKTIKTAQEAATDRIGMILLGNLVACEAAEGNYNGMKMLDELYQKGRLARGPRYAAYYAVLDVLSEIRADRAKFSMEPKMMGYKSIMSFGSRAMELCAAGSKGKTPSHRPGPSCKTTVGHDAKGVVKKVKKTKEGTKILFKTEKWKEEDVECVDTNKIWMIDKGKVKYFQECTLKGYKWVKHTEKTTIIPNDAAAGIKRGMFFKGKADYPYDDKKFKRFGFPEAVYKNKKKKRLINFYGIKL
jgi:hypothetical protein